MRRLTVALLFSLIACQRGAPRGDQPPPAATPAAPRANAPADPAVVANAPSAAANPSATPPSAAAPAASSVQVAETGGDVFETAEGQLRVVPIHHAALRFEHAGKHIYVDPAPADQMPDAPKADLILITDIHKDHLDTAGIAKVRKPETQIVGPIAARKDVPELTALNNGERRKVLAWNIEAVPMYNLKRGPKPGALFHDKGRGNGYVLELGGVRVYVSGDTECTPEMRALKKIDVAFVCMNLPYTMPPEEAGECVRAFQPTVVYPYHSRGSDLSKFKAALEGTKAVQIRERNWYPKPG